MTGDNVKHADRYDPFVVGHFPVAVRTIQAHDKARDRLFPCEIWYPAAQPGTYPLIVFSHGTAPGARRMATYLCTHLCSHGYIVAAMDHFEVVAPEVARPTDGETSEQLAARVDVWIANRVPDIRFLLDHLLSGEASDSEARLDPARIGIVGFSFGGWTALAATEADSRIQAVVALAPAGSSHPKPGIIPVKLAFAWGRDVPALYLVAENDSMTPLTGMYELFERTPATKRMFILRRADHVHFLDDAEQLHETFRTMPLTGDVALLQKEMLPFAELCSAAEAHAFVCGLTLCHMDAVLKRKEEAQRFADGGIEAELAARGVDAIVCKP